MAARGKKKASRELLIITNFVDSVSETVSNLERVINIDTGSRRKRPCRYVWYTGTGRIDNVKRVYDPDLRF